MHGGYVLVVRIVIPVGLDRSLFFFEGLQGRVLRVGCKRALGGAEAGDRLTPLAECRSKRMHNNCMYIYINNNKMFRE